MAVANHKTKQGVVTEFRCTEILEAARKVFAKKGFDQTTVDAIAAAAGIAKGTLYLYFRSKRDIYVEALKRDVLQLHRQTSERVAAAASIRDKIRAFISTRVTYLEQNRDFFKIYYAEFKSVAPLASAPRGFRDMYLEHAGMLERVLRDAVEQGDLRNICPRATAFRIYDMTLGLIAQRLLGWSNASADEDVDSLFDLLWRGIGTQHEN
jgi:AcrR family transcriptional regulator